MFVEGRSFGEDELFAPSEIDVAQLLYNRIAPYLFNLNERNVFSLVINCSDHFIIKAK